MSLHIIWSLVRSCEFLFSSLVDDPVICHRVGAQNCSDAHRTDPDTELVGEAVGHLIELADIIVPEVALPDHFFWSEGIKHHRIPVVDREVHFSILHYLGKITGADDAVWHGDDALQEKNMSGAG